MLVRASTSCGGCVIAPNGAMREYLRLGAQLAMRRPKCSARWSHSGSEGLSKFWGSRTCNEPSYTAAGAKRYAGVPTNNVEALNILETRRLVTMYMQTNIGR